MKKDKDLYYLKRYYKVITDTMPWTDSDVQDEIKELGKYLRCRNKKSIDSSTTIINKKGK